MIHDAPTLLGDAGPIARAIGNAFESRPEQLDMARAVARTLDARSHLLVEAGTGVGKSFAYLVPAMLRAALNNETVVVATNTIALQEQLVTKDIPLLLRALEAPEGETPTDDRFAHNAVRPVLVKGRGNYVSIRRMNLALERSHTIFSSPDSLRSLDVIRHWVGQTLDGSLSTMREAPRPEVWDQVRSDKDNCMGRKCRHYDECFYQDARRKMEKANLLICNHAVFFADLALRIAGQGMLPRYDHVIIDEAHAAEDVAAEHLGMSLTEGQVAHLLRTLYASRRQRGYLAHLAIGAGTIEPVDRAIKLVLAAEDASRDYFDAWRELHQSGRLRNGRVHAGQMVDNNLTPALKDLSLALTRLKDLVKSEADRFELNSYAVRAAALAAGADAFNEQSIDACVYWVDVGTPARPGLPPRVTLAGAPIEVGPILREHLFATGAGVVLTSATLATRAVVRTPEGDVPGAGAFDHVIDRLGAEGAETLLLGSPFDLDQQVEVHVDLSVPDPRRGDSAQYVDALAGRVLHHAIATDAGAFVLFTSFATLRAVASRVRGPLSQLDMPVLVQGEDAPRTLLLEQFRANPRSVLLGAASFWQGVDVQGHALRNVIITKLPFDPPDRPLTEARLERIRDKGGNPFMDDSLPRALIRFKQGIGRLVRSKTDTGRLVILDPRIRTKPYGKAFMALLPRGVQRIDDEF